MRIIGSRAWTGISLFLPVLCLMCLAAMATPILAGTIQSPLDEIIAESSSGEKIGVVVVMADMVDNAALNQDLKARQATLAQRHYEVVTALRQKASDTQGPVLAVLHKLETEGKVERIRNFWISNMISFKGTAEAIKVVADMPEIDRVVFDYPVETIKPVEVDETPPVITSVEPGLEVINAPQVWALGYTGAGRLVSNIDTGVDGNHVALSSRWRGNWHPASECWFDPVQGHTFPTDHGSHGTHTMGTICGRSTAGDTVGVAIEALWIGAASVDYGGTTADIIASFEFIADPDGNPETVDDVPDAVGNSWGYSPFFHGVPHCDDTFWSVMDGCENAGCAVIFSAGNEGSYGANSLRTPADRATTYFNAFSVGAVDGNNPSLPIADFSSLGPCQCATGDMAIKPECVAPGVNVRSSVPGNSYDYYSGTSMASPHITGSVAILRQVNPNLDVDTIKDILLQSCIDLGPTGEDNTYGHGVIDLYAAVQMAMTGFGWIDGYVTDATNSDPLPARVEIVGSSISTNANSSGYYILAAAADTTYTLRASLFGYFPQEQSIYVVEDDTVSLDFQLEPVPPPDMSWSPPSFNVTTQPGNIEERNLTLTNDGDGPLYYTLSTEIDVLSGNNDRQSPQPLGYRKTDYGKAGAIEEPYFPPIITGQGGPDNFGHMWIDSDEPGGPTYSWIDISGIGTPIDFGADIDDGNSGPLPFGFSFYFYGNEFTSINVCSNGWASFTDGSTVSWSNSYIPDPALPNDMLAIFYDDLNFENGGTGYFYTNNVDTAIITWDHVPDWRQEGIFTFQIILTAPAHITYQYSEMGPGRLDECSIGIENSNGSDGLEVAYNASYMHSNLAITFYTHWLSAFPASGIIDPHDSFNATITFDASMLSEGTYTGNINLESNDPVNPDVDIPCAFVVSLTYEADAGVSAILSPPDTVENGLSYPLVSEIKNYGTEPQTFDVIYEIYMSGSSTTEVSDTFTVTNMPASDVDTITFSDTFTPTVDTTYDLISYTILEGDLNNSNDTTTTISYCHTPVSIWYGNLDGSPITGLINNRVYVDVYIQTPENAYIADMHLCLGTDDQYIDSLLSDTEGELYYPLTEWDDASFLPPQGVPPNPAGWSSQSFLGWADLAGDPNPWLHFETPTRIMTFVVKTVNNQDLIGDTVQCFAPGVNIPNGGSTAGDTLGLVTYSLVENFSQLYFGESSGCDYVPGDINDDDYVMGNDVTYGVRYFKGLGDPPPDSCWNDSSGTYLYASGDVNGNCEFSGSDITYLVAFFKGYLEELLWCPWTPPLNPPIPFGKNNDETPAVLPKK